jgi:hypothetical protein
MPRNGNDDDIIIIKKHKTVRTMRRHRENRPKLEQFDMNNDYDDMRSFRQRKMVPRFFNLGNIQSYLGFPRNRFAREVIGLPEGLIADEDNSKGTKRELREPVASDLIFSNEDGMAESILSDDKDLNKRVIKDEARAASVILDENEKDGEEKAQKVKKSGEKILKKIIKVEKVNQPSGRAEEAKSITKKDFVLMTTLNPTPKTPISLGLVMDTEESIPEKKENAKKNFKD